MLGKVFSKVKQLIKDFGPPCLIGIILGVIINSLVGLTTVRGVSMYPTLQDGDQLIMDRTIRFSKKVNKGDIVVFNARNLEKKNKDIYYVKRVIATEGDHIQISNGKVILNGKELVENYTDNSFINGDIDLTVPKGSYFVLGDNRDESADSRVFGPIKHESLSGVIAFQIMPKINFDKFK